tara:strand:+ start:157 stop:441 length:285 start_codon:yes stop_codon:yes gene_type:complete
MKVNKYLLIILFSLLVIIIFINNYNPFKNKNCKSECCNFIENFEENKYDLKSYREFEVDDKILEKDKFIRSYGSSPSTTGNMFTERNSIFYNIN